jgi:ribosomal protein S18 acetylase RimI-like enzyme
LTSTIRALQGGDAPLIADIITNAFDDDPLMLWVFGQARKARASYAAIARSVYLRVGFGHVAADGAGGALWLPPGASAAPPSGLAGLAISLRILAAGGLRALFRAEQTSLAVLSHRPTEPHYYLFAIGVRREERRRGLGTALMAETLARCDREGLPAHLESSKAQNVAFYGRFGFQVTHRLAVAEGGPDVWLMRREPR